MRLEIRLTFWLASMALLMLGCGNTPSGNGNGATGNGDPNQAINRCGDSELSDVRSERDPSEGILQISNDSANLYLTYTPSSGSVVQALEVFYGSAQEFPIGTGRRPDYRRFPLRTGGLLESNERTISIEWSDMPTCIVVAARFQLSKNGEIVEAYAGLNGDSTGKWGIPYCRRPCSKVALICSLQGDASLPQTVAQEQWAEPFAQEANRSVHQFFRRLFPQGIELGCNRKVRFASADEALAALPSQGPARALPEEASAQGNQLLGELLSLTLLTRLDDIILEFTPHSAPVKRLEVARGAFEGWTVEEVAQEANIVLGGCTTNFTADQIYEVVREINLSYSEGGKRDFLRCPTE